MEAIDTITKLNTEKHRYASIIEKYGVEFNEDEHWLTVGNIDYHKKWILFLSTKASMGIKLIEIVVPVLINNGIGFRIIKDTNNHIQLNALLLGIEEVGKVITIFPLSEKQAVELVRVLLPMTNQFKGPRVENGIRVGETLYVSFCEEAKDDNGGSIMRLTTPGRFRIPFEIEKKYRLLNKKKRLIGRHYIPKEALRVFPKGDIYKAINIKKMKLDWCLVKEGKANIVDDEFGRGMKDRLLWEKFVLENLQGSLPVPKVIEFFEEGEDSYLVMEFIEGVSLHDKVITLLNNQDWKYTPNSSQIEILKYYKQILENIQAIHESGFVHRDITDRNFLIKSDGRIFIIDFEIAFSLFRGEPNPPFILGTPGYIAPEQFLLLTPTKSEDIYSLGALFIFLITGKNPSEFIEENYLKTESKLIGLINDEEISKTMIKCLSKIPSERPEISKIMDIVRKRIVLLEQSRLS